MVGGLLANDVGAGAEWVGSDGKDRPAGEMGQMIIIGLRVRNRLR